MSRRSERLIAAPPSKYLIAARESVPINSDCYDCEWKWHGQMGRAESAKHRSETGHATWTEGRPKDNG